MIFLPIIFLIISFVGIFFLVLEKVLEIKTGRVGKFAKLSLSTDDTFSAYVNVGKEFLSKLNFRSLKTLFHNTISFLFHIFGVLGLFISKYHSRLLSKVNGKKSLKGKGVVSFFLKDVAESKGEERDNKSNF